MRAKLLVISGFHPETKQLMIYEECYGSREATNRLTELSARHPEYTFTMRAKIMCDYCKVRLILADTDEYGRTYECPLCGEEYWEKK